jgi:hypothetical protein
MKKYLKYFAMAALAAVSTVLLYEAGAWFFSSKKSPLVVQDFLQEPSSLAIPPEKKPKSRRDARLQDIARTAQRMAEDVSIPFKEGYKNFDPGHTPVSTATESAAGVLGADAAAADKQNKFPFGGHEFDPAQHFASDNQMPPGYGNYPGAGQPGSYPGSSGSGGGAASSYTPPSRGNGGTNALNIPTSSATPTFGPMPSFDPAQRSDEPRRYDGRGPASPVERARNQGGQPATIGFAPSGDVTPAPKQPTGTPKELEEPDDATARRLGPVAGGVAVAGLATVPWWSTLWNALRNLWRSSPEPAPVPKNNPTPVVEEPTDDDSDETSDEMYEDVEPLPDNHEVDLSDIAQAVADAAPFAAGAGVAAATYSNSGSQTEAEPAARTPAQEQAEYEAELVRMEGEGGNQQPRPKGQVLQDVQEMQRIEENIEEIQNTLREKLQAEQKAEFDQKLQELRTQSAKIIQDKIDRDSADLIEQNREGREKIQEERLQELDQIYKQRNALESQAALERSEKELEDLYKQEQKQQQALHKQWRQDGLETEALHDWNTMLEDQEKERKSLHDLWIQESKEIKNREDLRIQQENVQKKLQEQAMKELEDLYKSQRQDQEDLQQRWQQLGLTTEAINEWQKLNDQQQKDTEALENKWTQQGLETEAMHEWKKLNDQQKEALEALANKWRQYGLQTEAAHDLNKMFEDQENEREGLHDLWIQESKKIKNRENLKIQHEQAQAAHLEQERQARNAWELEQNEEAEALKKHSEALKKSLDSIQQAEQEQQTREEELQNLEEQTTAQGKAINEWQKLNDQRQQDREALENEWRSEAEQAQNRENLKIQQEKAEAAHLEQELQDRKVWELEHNEEAEALKKHSDAHKTNGQSLVDAEDEVQKLLHQDLELPVVPQKMPSNDFSENLNKESSGIPIPITESLPLSSKPNLSDIGGPDGNDAGLEGEPVMGFVNHTPKPPKIFIGDLEPQNTSSTTELVLYEPKDVGELALKNKKVEKPLQLPQPEDIFLEAMKQTADNSIVPSKKSESANSWLENFNKKFGSPYKAAGVAPQGSRFGKPLPPEESIIPRRLSPSLNETKKHSSPAQATQVKSKKTTPFEPSVESLAQHLEDEALVVPTTPKRLSEEQTPEGLQALLNDQGAVVNNSKQLDTPQKVTEALKILDLPTDALRSEWHPAYLQKTKEIYNKGRGGIGGTSGDTDWLKKLNEAYQTLQAWDEEHVTEFLPARDEMHLQEQELGSSRPEAPTIPQSAVTGHKNSEYLMKNVPSFDKTVSEEPTFAEPTLSEFEQFEAARKALETQRELYHAQDSYDSGTREIEPSEIPETDFQGLSNVLDRAYQGNVDATKKYVITPTPEELTTTDFGYDLATGKTPQVTPQQIEAAKSWLWTLDPTIQLEQMQSIPGLRKIYLQQALQTHPDMPQGSKRKFQILANAVEILTKAAQNPQFVQESVQIPAITEPVVSGHKNRADISDVLNLVPEVPSEKILEHAEEIADPRFLQDEINQNHQEALETQREVHHEQEASAQPENSEFNGVDLDEDLEYFPGSKIFDLPLVADSLESQRARARADIENIETSGILQEFLNQSNTYSNEEIIEQLIEKGWLATETKAMVDKDPALAKYLKAVLDVARQFYIDNAQAQEKINKVLVREQLVAEALDIEKLYEEQARELEKLKKEENYKRALLAVHEKAEQRSIALNKISEKMLENEQKMAAYEYKHHAVQQIDQLQENPLFKNVILQNISRDQMLEQLAKDQLLDESTVHWIKNDATIGQLFDAVAKPRLLLTTSQTVPLSGAVSTGVIGLGTAGALEHVINSAGKKKQPSYLNPTRTTSTARPLSLPEPKSERVDSETKADGAEQFTPAEKEAKKVEELRNKLAQARDQEVQKALPQDEVAKTAEGLWKKWLPNQGQAVSGARTALQALSALPYVAGAANALGGTGQSNVGATSIQGATTGESGINESAVEHLIGPRNVSLEYLGSVPTNSQVSSTAPNTLVQSVQGIQLPRFPRIK